MSQVQKFLLKSELAMLLAVPSLTMTPLQAADSIAASVRVCAAEADATRRLACYDKNVAPLAADAAHAEARNHFGADSALAHKPSPGSDEPAKLNKLQARVTTLSHGAKGELVLRLDNGQTWTQSEDGPDLRIEVGDQVTIDRGVLGAYWLSGSHSRAAVKVRRN